MVTSVCVFLSNDSFLHYCTQFSVTGECLEITCSCAPWNDFHICVLVSLLWQLLICMYTLQSHSRRTWNASKCLYSLYCWLYSVACFYMIKDWTVHSVIYNLMLFYFNNDSECYKQKYIADSKFFVRMKQTVCICKVTIFLIISINWIYQ